MKVIKRDGRAVEYDRQKIVIAIEKANKEVRKTEKANEEDIEKIIEYIEELGKKRILVEDIQDIIEQKLMEFKKFELAKKYIVYRYTRALVRKQNTTDESILGIIRNTNKSELNNNIRKNIAIVSTQRDLIAGEVSRDLTKRILLPEKISKAHEDGIIYFHDSDYFLQPMFNCCLVNIKDMLENGTVINGNLIESPHTFQVACIVMTQIIASVASCQYGEQSIDISHLGKYLRKTYIELKKKLNEEYKNKLSKEIIEEITQTRIRSELKQGIQTIQYQINTLITTNGNSPSVTLFLNLDKDDEYIQENALIIEEILKQRYQGIKNEDGNFSSPAFPKLVYVLHEHNCLRGGKYDYLTKIAIKCSAKRMYPTYISAKKMHENYGGNIFSPMGTVNFLPLWKDENGNYKFEGRFNQGVVSINLPQIGIISEGNEKKFWEILDERLDLCKEALMCRHYSLLGTSSEVSPILWKYGAISRLKSGEKIDKLLKSNYSTLSLGYVGIYETTKLVKGVSHTAKEGHEFAIKLIKHLKNTTDKWNKETGLGFTIYGIVSNKLCHKFAQIDKEKFGDIKDITDKGYYTSSYHVDCRENLDLFTKLSFESEFEKISSGGGISYIDIPNMSKNINSIEKIVKYIYDNIQCIKFNNISNCCSACGYDGEIILNENNKWECPQCGNEEN